MTTKNLNEYFGGGILNVGGGGTSGSLSDLTDVNLITPVAGDALKFNGTQWVNDQISWLELADTPIVPAGITDLVDVDTTGVTTNQILRWDGTNWLPSADLGATQLNELSDVTVSAATDGFVLRANGSVWVATQLDYIDIANTPTIPTNSNFSLTGLSDTVGTSVADGFLRWDAGGTSVIYTAIDAASDITGLSAVATSGTFTSLNDVDTTGVTDGQILSYSTSGAEWVPSDFSSNRIQDADNDTFVDVSAVDDTVTITAGPDGGDILLNPNTSVNSGAGVIIGGALGAVISSIDLTLATTAGDIELAPSTGIVAVTHATAEIAGSADLEITAVGDLAFQGQIWPAADGTANQLLATDGSGNLSWIAAGALPPVDSVFGRTGVVTALVGDYSAFYATTAQGTLADSALQGTDSIDALSDVDTTTATPTLNQGLVWNNTNWVPGTVSTVDVLNDLSDVAVTSVATNDVLQYTGSQFANTQLSYDTLGDKPVAGTDFAAVSHNHIINDTTGLQSALDAKADRDTINNMLDVNTTAGAVDGQVLTWNNSTSNWERALPVAGSTSRIEDGDSDTFVDTELSTNTVNIGAPDGGGGIVLDPGDQSVQIIGTGGPTEIDATTALTLSTVAGDITIAPFTDNLNIPATLTASAGVEVVSGGSLTIDGQIFPASIGATNQVLTILDSGAGTLGWTAPSSGVTEFLALNDTPSSYSGEGGKVVAVNSGGTALEFIAAPGGAVDSVFGRTGVVAAAASDYDASQIDNDSTVTGAFVDDALNTLNTAIGNIDFSGKADKIIPSTVGDFAGLDAAGNLTDSGVGAADFATAAQGTLADSALQPGSVDNVSELINDAGYITSVTAAPVDSVFGRIGIVVATLNDYSASLVDNDSAVAGVTVKNALETLNTAIGGKADKAVPTSAGDFAGLDATGNLIDSGVGAADFATAAQGTLADSALQNGDNVSELTNDANYTSSGDNVSVFTNDAGYLTTIDLSAESIGDLSDVDLTGNALGKILEWNGSSFVVGDKAGGGSTTFAGLSDTPVSYTGGADKILKVNSTPNGIEYGADIADLENVDATAPANGEVLTYNGGTWGPAASSGGAAQTTELLRIDYNLNGTVTNAATNVSEKTSNINTVTFTSTAANNIIMETTFTNHDTPPASIVYYGYSYDSVQYVMKLPITNGNLISVTGTAASPGLINGAFSSQTMQNKVDKDETGSSNGGGLPGFATHAYIMFKF